MTSLAEALPAEINRVIALKGEYVSLRDLPEVNVAPAIAMMTASIERAIRVSIEGDGVGMVAALADLREYTL